MRTCALVGLVSGIMLLLAGPCSSAARAYFVAGGAFSSQTFDPPPSDELGIHSALHLGVGGQVYLTQAFSIAADVTLVQKGAPRTGPDHDVPTIDLQYLSVPVVLKLRFPSGPVDENRDHWYLGAGPRLDLLLNDGLGQLQWLPGDFEPIVFGLDVSAGRTVLTALFLEMRYSHSFTPAYSSDGLTGYDTTVSFLFGVTFWYDL